MTAVLALTDLGQLFGLPAVQRSALALLIASVGLPVVGVLMIGLDIVPARFAVMHTALLGVAIGLASGIDPLLCGLLVSGVAMVAMTPLASRPGGLSGPMGIVMTLSIAGALLVLSISGVNATGAFELLWGSILATRRIDIVLLLVITIAVLTLCAVAGRQIGLLLFDREMALCSGVRVGTLTAICLGATAIAIASSIRLTGALLVDAVTLLPALAARNLASSFGSMIAWAIACGVVGNGIGLLVALLFDQPPGPVLVVSVAVLALVSFLPNLPGTRPTTKGPLH